MFLICKPNCPRTDIFLECWELLLIYNKSLVCNSINNTGCPNCTECSWQHKDKRCVNRKYIQMCASLQLDKTGKHIALELYLYEYQINIIHGHSLRIPVMDMVSVVSVSCMVTERRKLLYGHREKKIINTESYSTMSLTRNFSSQLWG